MLGFRRREYDLWSGSWAGYRCGRRTLLMEEGYERVEGLCKGLLRARRSLQMVWGAQATSTTLLVVEREGL